MKKRPEYEFCMKQFKPAIAGLTLVLLAIIGWTSWHCVDSPRYHQLQLVAAQAPSAPPIGIRDKMLHPYWGNCNKCHITTGVGKPISKVMAGPPITIKQTMTHKYWGNCLLCHKVTDGFQSPARNNAPRMRAAAFQQTSSAAAAGLSLQAVTMALMQQFGLANEDGLLVLAVSPGSAAAQAGLLPGDEIVRAGRSRLDTVNDFEAALNTAKVGETVKLQLYRGTRARSLFLRKPGQSTSTAGQAPLSQNQVETLATQLGVTKTPQAINQALSQQAQTTAMQTPMTQNQVETLAEQLGVPKTPQAVNQALAQQRQSQPVAMINSGPVAVAATGPGLNFAVSSQFDTSPYFVVYDPVQRACRVATNPNANDLTGHGVQSGQLMVDLNVTAVIAGQFSPEALQTLHTLRVSAYSGVTGTVQNALNAYHAHGLAPAQANITAAAAVYPPPTGHTPHPVGNLPITGVY